MLIVKQPQWLLRTLNGLGSLALGILVFIYVGSFFWAVVGVAAWFGFTFLVMINNQGQDQTLQYGYSNLEVLLFSLLWIALAVHWLVSVLLLVIFAALCCRYLSNTIGPNSG